MENLVVSVGAIVHEGRGSRVGFEYNGIKFFCHRPHPGKEAPKYVVEGVRELLTKAGFSYE